MKNEELLGFTGEVIERYKSKGKDAAIELTHLWVVDGVVGAGELIQILHHLNNAISIYENAGANQECQLV